MVGDRLIDTFVELVRIDSPSGAEAAVADYCARRLEGLGFSVSFDDTRQQTGSDTGNLFAQLPGDEPATLVLSAHMDCVQPCEGVEPLVGSDEISSAGETVLGADDKAGIAAILETATRLVESGRPRPTLRVVLTVAEEIGLQGAKALDAQAVNGDLCLVLDADGPVGGIVIGAPTHYTFVATFWGRASHAGVAPREGRSAIVMASRAIAAMKLGQVDEITTANIGSIEGGTATNVIAARVFVTGECRSLDSTRVEEVRAAMDTAMSQAAQAGEGSVDIRWTREYVGFASAEDSSAVGVVRDACARIGIEASTFTTGGGSDGNIFAAAGIPTLVLACGMRSVHSTEERIAISDLRALADLVESTAVAMAEARP